MEWDDGVGGDGGENGIGSACVSADLNLLRIFNVKSILNCDLHLLFER